MTPYARACLIVCLAFLWLYFSALAAPPRVSIHNPGRVASAPADWWITIAVDPHPDHRSLIIIADGQPGEYRRSDITLEGEQAPKIRQQWFKALSAGCYYFTAAVTDTSTVLASATSGPVAIIGREGNPCPELWP